MRRCVAVPHIICELARQLAPSCRTRISGVVLCLPGLLFIDSGPGPGLVALFLRVALAGSSLPQWRASRVGQPLALPGAPPRATRSAPMARALRAREATVRAAASLVAASRYALCARRRGGAARLCAGPGSRWARLPSPLLAAITLRARRRWCGRCAPGRLRQPGRRLALRARRRWCGRCARPGAYTRSMCSSP